MKLLTGVIVGTLVLVFGIAFLFSSGEESSTGEPEVFNEELVVGEARHVRGGAVEEGAETDVEASDEAGMTEGVVTVVEFSDFQCPACKSAEPIVQQVLARYGDRVRLIYRHFPLDSIHKNARQAAIASEVMAAEGLFWEYHDLLFEKQEEWEGSSKVADLLDGYATELGVAEGTVKDGVDQAEFRDLVEADIVGGRALNVNSTPSFFVNGKRVNTNELLSEVEQHL